MKLSNKIALITGATSGIGFAIAELFIQEGAEVIITGTDSKNIKKIKAELGEKCFGLVADISKLNNIDDLFQTASHHFNRKIDILVANAGIVHALPADKVTENDFDKLMSVNLKGTYFTVQKSIPYLNNSSSVILISSLAGKAGMENFSVYCATKAAIISLAKTFAAELANKKIRVNSISPGVVKTPVFNKLGVNENDLLEWSKLIPMKRVAEPNEIAAMALYLASDESSYVTAADFAIDGGLSGVSLF